MRDRPPPRGHFNVGTWVRVQGPDSGLRNAIAPVYGKPKGWIVVRASGCRLSPVGPEFATEAEAIAFAAAIRFESERTEP